MTAIPQWGNSDWEFGCKLPAVCVARALDLEAEAAEAAAAEAERAMDEDAAADDEEAMDDVTESASVVSARGLVYSRAGGRRQMSDLRTALNVACGISVPSNVTSERVITQ